MTNYDLHRAVAILVGRTEPWVGTEGQALVMADRIVCPQCETSYSFWHDKRETEEGKQRHAVAFLKAITEDHPGHSREAFEDGNPNRITHDSSKWPGGKE
jgi:hypothetical protein